jgi:hypothetical protein
MSGDQRRPKQCEALSLFNDKIDIVQSINTFRLEHPAKTLDLDQLISHSSFPQERDAPTAKFLESANA